MRCMIQLVGWHPTERKAYGAAGQVDWLETTPPEIEYTGKTSEGQTPRGHFFQLVVPEGSDQFQQNKQISPFFHFIFYTFYPNNFFP